MKYICTSLQKEDLLPGPTPEERRELAADGKRLALEHVHWIDQDVIPGAYYGETTWMWPSHFPDQVTWDELASAGKRLPILSPHAHHFPELLSWWSVDPDHPEDIDLMFMQIEDEVIPLLSSWVAYVPAGLSHMPILAGKHGPVVTRPTLHWTSGPGGVYTRERSQESGGDGERSSAGQTAAGTATSRQAAAGNATPGQARLVEQEHAKYGRYILYGNAPDVRRPEFLSPPDPENCRPLVFIDQTVIPDAEFGCDTRWYLPGGWSRPGHLIMDTHTEPHGTSLALIAYDYNNLTELGAEAELWIAGERHLLTKGFWAYIPPRVSQGPLIIRNVTKQLFFKISYPVGEGVSKYPGGS